MGPKRAFCLVLSHTPHILPTDFLQLQLKITNQLRKVAHASSKIQSFLFSSIHFNCLFHLLCLFATCHPLAGENINSCWTAGSGECNPGNWLVKLSLRPLCLSIVKPQPQYFHNCMSHTINHKVNQSSWSPWNSNVHLGPHRTLNGLWNTLYLASPNLRARRLRELSKLDLPINIYGFHIQALGRTTIWRATILVVSYR